jgi:3',5'-cyclic AMP phosphodiesterase CpdA
MVIITGDLIDFYEAETERGPLLATQIEQFVPLFNNCPVPLFVTLGNHDITSYWIEEIDSSTHSFQQHTKEARACWIRNLSCLQTGTYYRRTFDIGTTRYFFIFLDNSYNLQNGAFLDKIQLDWLDYQINLAGLNPVIIFMHKYLPVPDYNNDGFFFSKNSTLSINDSTCSKGFLKILNGNNNIKALFVGHGHRSVLENIPFPSGQAILQTETAGFAQDKNNWRLLKFTEKNIIIYSTGVENIIDITINIK